MARKKIKDELLDHDYDGIQELDNDLPPWWLYMFYFTIVFGFAYLLYFHVLDIGDLQAAEYQKEMQAAETMLAKNNAENQAQSPQEMTVLTDSENLAAGKEIFMTNCMACHGANGEGGVGPNMTDEYWIHGGAFSDIVNTIVVGVPAKGMISWKPILSPTQIQQVASYLTTLQGTNPPNGKEPQGEKYSGS
ncbi:MAG: cbb3-type cytochrome c oxidase N-terminal domain-containing protein [Calditrichia bacterium]|nr:c-type cytochrome [Calditrichota bacterium]MCB0266794.1 c-type cytochrome [Calditrichota bacterium]MCB9066365.1 c-type cytochrome [Calditrichia bacterium]